MSQIDLQNRRVDIKLVYWGPARGGKTTTLRSLHGACEAKERGELASVDTEDERTYYFDYAPLELPRYRGFGIRVHAYTVPGQEAYVETRRRVLRGVTTVVFVADASPGAMAASVSSWRQLHDALAQIEAGSAPRPVLVAANKQDVPGALAPEAVRRALAEAVPGRPILATYGASALEGRGVVRCFREALLASLDRALGPAAQGTEEGDRTRFVEALAGRFGGGEDGVALAGAPARRAVHVPLSSYDPDAGGLEAALEAHRWLASRDLDVRDLRRESSLGRLLVDLGHLCLSATDVDPLARSLLATMVMSLEAVTGWIGLPDPAGVEQVYDAMGLAADAAVVSETARLLHVGCAEGRAVPVGAGTSASLPGGAAGGRGLFLPFSVGAGRRGWILLVGPPGRGLPDDAEAVLATTGAFLGLATGRLAAVRSLRAANAVLEQKVAERTQDLLAEKAGLEERVAQRTFELEEAKRATLEAERRLLDRERSEGVQRLAAGIAHEVNNPVGAARANLDYLLESIDRAARPGGRVEEGDLAEMRSAVEDARRDVDRVVASVRGLFGEAVSSRRALARTPLAAAARDAIAAFRDAVPGVPTPRLVEREGVYVGAPSGECVRWIFRVLGLVAGGRPAALRLETDQGADGPRLVLVSDEPIPAASDGELAALAREIEGAGGRLDAASPGHRAQVVMAFPSAPGETRTGAAVRSLA